MKGVMRNVLKVGGLTTVSRLLGLVREMMQSRLIGAGVEQSAFTLAFALPNMSRKLFGEGALTAAFVPVFAEAVAKGDVESARRLVRAVQTTVMLILGSVTVLCIIGLSCFIGGELSSRAALTLRLVRILAPYMLFICGAAFGMGVLNALGKFSEGAFMPILLNVIWIASLGVMAFFPGSSVETRVCVVCWAILAGGAAQMFFLFRCMARRGYSPRLDFSCLWTEKTRLVWRNTACGAIGAGAVQLNYMLDQVLAQCAAPWAAGVIGYAERLMDLPLGIIGVAFGTVLLPTFAGYFAHGDFDGARASLNLSVCHLMAVMLPAAVGLVVVAPELTAVIYEGRAFDAVATVRVSRSLAVYATGLGFFGLQKALIPWFQAQKDMKTPLRVSLGTVSLNAVLNVLAVCLLPQEWRHVGLAASTVVCALAGCALLAFLASRRPEPTGLLKTLPIVFRMLVAALAMGGALLTLRPFLSGWNRFAALSAEIAVGIAVYAAFMAVLGLFGYLRRVRP